MRLTSMRHAYPVSSQLNEHMMVSYMPLLTWMHDRLARPNAMCQRRSSGCGTCCDLSPPFGIKLALVHPPESGGDVF